jgi:hypothetical protein
MLIRVEQGKGGKDRYVMLSPQLLHFGGGCDQISLRDALMKRKITAQRPGIRGMSFSS